MDLEASNLEACDLEEVVDEEEVVDGGVIEDSRLLRKPRNSASACSSRVNCRAGGDSCTDIVDGDCPSSRLSGCEVLMLLSELLLGFDDHHQPIVDI